MRAVVQRVRSAVVRVSAPPSADRAGSDPQMSSQRLADPRVAGEVVGAIGVGVLVLVGVTHDDDRATAQRLARKVHELRILEGERSVADVDAGILVVSQFTLYADVRKGRRPSWADAAPAHVARPLVDAVVDELRALGARVEVGRFGVRMQIDLEADGPVTILLDL